MLYLSAMKIGFDAKRAFHNGTGLGHYSRTLIHSLAKHYPEHEYFLFNPKKRSAFEVKGEGIREINPGGFLNAIFSSAWRSSWVKADLKKYHIDLYHGLSHEIPIGIQKTGIPSVVTIHDLIHERYPEQYSAIDVKIYSKKFRNACEHANRVIAISEQTKNDIIRFYKVDAGKIDTCYQSCNPAFGETVSAEEKELCRQKYRLPDQYFLYVGSVIERKNLLNICKAIFLLGSNWTIPLVVIGDGGSYKKKVQEFVSQNKLEKKLIFLSDQDTSSYEGYRKATDFPAIYQSAIAMIYPSFFEGFGIPVLEALWSRLPVITSNISSLPEAGGHAAYYVNPGNPEEIGEAMKKIYADPSLAENMKEAGWLHAQKFSQQSCAGQVMEVYKKITAKL